MRFSKAVMLTAWAGAMTTASVVPAPARDNTGAIVAAGVAGLVIGGIIASQARPYHYYYYRRAPRVYYYGPPPGYYYGYYGRPVYIYSRSAAIDYCLRRFRSYDPRTMTYLGYDGRRHRCP